MTEQHRECPECECTATKIAGGQKGSFKVSMYQCFVCSHQFAIFYLPDKQKPKAHED